MNVLTKWTLLQMVYGYWDCPPQVKILQGEDSVFARRAYYGYRTESQVGSWTSKLAEGIENGDYDFEELLTDEYQDDLYVSLDVNSFYPSVMSSRAVTETYYPAGESRRSDEGEAEYLKGTVGMYEVEFVCPPDLARGVLPTRASEKRIDWPTDKGYGVYTEVDLQLAEDYGYTVTFKGPCLLWDEVCHPFDDYVQQFYDLKQKEQDPVRRDVWKIILNGLSGKLGQGAAGKAKDKQLVPCRGQEVRDRIKAGLPLVWDGENCWKPTVDTDTVAGVAESVPVIGVQTKPGHLGAYLMSWSRSQMSHVQDIVGLNSVYEHTDSFRVPLRSYFELQRAGWISPTELGKLKLEHGLIYEYWQGAGSQYTIKFLTPSSDLDFKECGLTATEKKERAAQCETE